MYIFECLSQETGDKALGGTQEESVDLLDMLGENVTGVSLNRESGVALVVANGVKQAKNVYGVDKLLESTGESDTGFEVFGCKYFLTVRGDVILITQELDVHEDTSSLPDAAISLAKRIGYAGGISIIGSPNAILLQPIISEIANRINSPICKLFKQGDIFICYHILPYHNNPVVNKFTNLESAIRYLKNSAVKVIFLEAYSGIEISNEVVELASLGKSIVCAQLGFSSVYALSGMMKKCDKAVLASVFSGAMFVDVLPYVKGKNCPKISFGDHEGFLKWGALKTSPTKTELVLTNPSEGVCALAETELWLSEAIEPSKLVSRWISEGAASIDMVANLRLDGWLSIADEASIAVRDEIVTFDSVLCEITFV